MSPLIHRSSTSARRPRLSHRFLPILTLAAGWCATGCATYNGKSGPPLNVWRQKVTDYVAAEGHGDPSCLRDTVDMRSRRTVRPAAITFSSLSNSYKDARGVLAGQHTADGRAWYFFLVAVHDNNPKHTMRILEIRPIAFYADADGLHWQTGDPDDLAQGKYLRSRYPQASGSAALPEIFPGPADLFRLTVAGNTATIAEERSGAAWTLQFPADTDTRSAHIARQTDSTVNQ